MDRAPEWGALADERRHLEHDLAVGEWERARRRMTPLLGRLLGACTPGGEEIESWMRILTCLAEIPPPPPFCAQLMLWPVGEPGKSAGGVARPSFGSARGDMRCIPGSGREARRGRETFLVPGGANGNVAARMGVITQDARMLGALTLLEDLARTALPVFLEGESGTGKEVVARGVHRSSSCADAAFIAVNCGALPGELHESELFGHARGAYTGAAAEKPGLFEAAHGGSIFLDEIGEMDPRAQVKLLRVLESGELRRLGEIRTRQVNVRVIAATNTCVDEAVAAGRFRRDLLHRVAAIRVQLPPLRQRRVDILPLAEHFLRRALPRPPALSPQARAELLEHDWPGNVRELKYAMERAAALWALGREEELSRDLLLLHGMEAHREEMGHPRDPDINEPGWEERMGERGSVENEDERRRDEAARSWPDELPPGYTIDRLLAEIEAGVIQRALSVSEGNRTAAARLLGNLSRTTLIGKMKRLGLFPPSEDAQPAERE